MSTALSSLATIGNSYSDLPLELRLKIANNLPGDRAMRLALSDKNLYNSINNDGLFWKSQYEKLAGFERPSFKKFFSWKDLYVYIAKPQSYNSKCITAFCEAYTTAPEKIGNLFARICESNCWATITSTGFSVFTLVGAGGLLLSTRIAILCGKSESPNQFYDKEIECLFDRSLTGHPLTETVFGIGLITHIIAFCYFIRTKSYHSNNYAPLRLGRKIGSIQCVRNLFGKIASWMVKK